MVAGESEATLAWPQHFAVKLLITYDFKVLNNFGWQK
jgi:hypothetical protein